MSDGFVLGVDLGGTKTNIARVDRQGNILGLRRFVIGFENHAETLKDLRNAIDIYMAEECAGEKPLRMGIGLKGHVDRKNGIWKRCITIPGFEPVALGEAYAGRYGLPVLLDNDVHSATLAEMFFGAGRRYSDFIYFNVGTGIGIGMVVEGRLVRGASNYSGEISFMVTEPDERAGHEGEGLILEEVASGGAIIESARAALPEWPDSALNELEKRGELFSRTLFVAADAGDELAGKVASRALRSLNIGALAAVQIMNPQALIFGGGVMTDGWLLPRVEAHIRARALRPTAWALKEVALSPLGSGEVGVLGAACLGWEDLEQG